MDGRPQARGERGVDFDTEAELECMAQIIGAAVVSCPEVRRSLFKSVAHAGLPVRARVGVRFEHYREDVFRFGVSGGWVGRVFVVNDLHGHTFDSRCRVYHVAGSL